MRRSERLATVPACRSCNDMLVVDVEAAHLVEVATVVRDDPATRCDLYAVKAGVDTGRARSVTVVAQVSRRTSS